MAETEQTVETSCPDLISAEVLFKAFQNLEGAVQKQVVEKISQEASRLEDQQVLLEQIEKEKQNETTLLGFLSKDRKRGKAAQSAWFIEFDIEDPDAFIANNVLYVKKVLENTKATEVRYDSLANLDQSLFDEAKAREVAEVVESMALRRIQSEAEKHDAEAHPERHIPMRWLLTWKPLFPPSKPDGSGPHVVHPSGERKAKARVVLIGFRHPDLVKTHSSTGRPMLQTSSPTLSRLGKHCLLQAIAFDMHVLEGSDAKSAFLQADNQEEDRRLWTKAVPEIALALGCKPGELLRILGAIYGLTNAPRIFLKDVSEKLARIGAIQHPIDRCLWIVKDEQGTVCGRVGSQVDDFILAEIGKIPGG
jgi:hypothetical protein